MIHPGQEVEEEGRGHSKTEHTKAVSQDNKLQKLL